MERDRSRRRRLRSNPWKDRVRSVYSSLEELEAYDGIYGIVKRLGYASARELWDDNPMIGGSVYPEDLRVMHPGERLPRRGVRLPPARINPPPRLRKIMWDRIMQSDIRKLHGKELMDRVHGEFADLIDEFGYENVMREWFRCNPRSRRNPEGPSLGKPVCPNCGQWQYPSDKGYMDCMNDCAERGLAPKKTVVEISSAVNPESREEDWPEKVEPDEEDIVIPENERQAFYAGKMIAETRNVDWDDLSRQIVSWMNRNKYWGDVWHQDDHGGWNLVTKDVHEYAKHRVHRPARSERMTEIGSRIRQTVRRNTGEPDQDYDHEFFDVIVRQLSRAGFKGATHREFDKYQGVYLSVPSIDKFWITDFYFTGKHEREPGTKWMNAELFDPHGYQVSYSRGDYFTLPKDHVLRNYILRLQKFGGGWTEINNPTVGDLPDLGDVQRGPRIKKGTRIDVTVFWGENSKRSASVVQTESGDVDASELVALCRELRKRSKR